MANDHFEPESDFYFWAASNASVGTFPENKPQKFKNKFAQSMNLGENWEVALCEIYYPNNYHFNKEKIKEPAKFSILYNSNGSTYGQFHYTVNPASYSGDEEIALAINSALKNNLVGGTPIAKVEKSQINADRWELTTSYKHCEIFFENEAAQGLFWLLGFGQLKFFSDGYTFVPPISATASPVFDGKEVSATLFFFEDKHIFKHKSSVTWNWANITELDNHENVMEGKTMVMKLKSIEVGFTKKQLAFFATEYRTKGVRFKDKSSAEVFRKLGFYGYPSDAGTFTWNTLPIVAADPVLSIAQRPALFIYCDKIEYQMVGDTRAPLLLTVPVEAPEKQAVVWHAFQRLTYVPVRKGYINDIEIAITDDQGNPVQFKGGKVIIKLHFRKHQ